MKVETRSAAGYLFNHSDYLYLIDPSGIVRYFFHTDDKAQEIVDMIKKLGV